MLDDEIVLRNCYYWASKLMCKGIDFNALVSVGYIVGKPLKDERLLKDWLHFSMMKYIVAETESRNHCVGDDTSYMDNVEAAKETCDYNDLYLSINNAGLSIREYSVLNLHFFKGESQTKIAHLLNITQPTVSVYIKRAMEKIRNKHLKGVRK